MMSGRNQVWILLLALVAVLGGLVAFSRLNRGPEPAGAELVTDETPDLSGFQRVDGPVDLSFPDDHGPHPGYQTEWWYFTGNLTAEDGRHFGYQLTFFRRALTPETPDRESGWASTQVYMAHFALSDIGAGQFHAFERLTREAAGLAGAQAKPFTVWLEDWRFSEKAPGVYSLFASAVPEEGDGSRLTLELELEDLKGPVLQGDQGYSRKGSHPGQASAYYSFTRLRSRGMITTGEQRFAVDGFSWMDHEYSTSALSREQTGWDWFSLQFDDGTELMVFQIRRADGQIDPFSSGIFVLENGETRRLQAGDFSLEVLGSWKSPASGAEYPSGWRLHVPAEGLDLEIQPYMEAQELNVSYAYWEGAVRVSGTRQGQALGGNGYVELTGYAGSMGGEF